MLRNTKNGGKVHPGTLPHPQHSSDAPSARSAKWVTASVQPPKHLERVTLVEDGRMCDERE
jgi:hypothetical protein